MNKRIEWHLEIWNIDRLKPYKKNPRIITEDGINSLKCSFDEIGFAQPININTNGTILSGHARYEQLKFEGVREVEVYLPDRLLTPKQEEAVIIRMNKNVAGNWDFEKLANEFDFNDLIEWGFSDNELINSKIDEIDKLDLAEIDEDKSEYRIEVKFPNDMEMNDIKDYLMNRGYIVKVL